MKHNDGKFHLRSFCISCKEAFQLLKSVPNDEFAMPFGKHKGKKLSDLVKENPDYVRWLAENIKDGNVKTRAIEVLRNIKPQGSAPTKPAS